MSASWDLCGWVSQLHGSIFVWMYHWNQVFHPWHCPYVGSVVGKRMLAVSIGVHNVISRTCACVLKGAEAVPIWGRGNYTGFSGGPVVITRVHNHGRRRSLTVLCRRLWLGRKHRVHIACCWPEQYRKRAKECGWLPGAGKGRKWILLSVQKRAWQCWHLDFRPVRPALNFWPPELQDNTCAQFLVVCSRSSGTLIEVGDSVPGSLHWLGERSLLGWLVDTLSTLQTPVATSQHKLKLDCPQGVRVAVREQSILVGNH